MSEIAHKRHYFSRSRVYDLYINVTMGKYTSVDNLIIGKVYSALEGATELNGANRIKEHIVDAIEAIQDEALRTDENLGYHFSVHSRYHSQY
jgi:hypothetical protein